MHAKSPITLLSERKHELDAAFSRHDKDSAYRILAACGFLHAEITEIIKNHEKDEGCSARPRPSWVTIKHFVKRRITFIGITGFLVVLFLATFFHIKPSPIGPYSDEDRDDLGITSAYLDASLDILYLVAAEHWAKIDLSVVRRQTAKLQYSATPCSGNFLHWSSFKDGKPPLNVYHLEPVAVCTSHYATFEYNKDGPPRSCYEKSTQPPDGYRYALFRSNRSANDEGIVILKSYILQTPSRGSDGKFGVQFFFNPDVRYGIAPRESYIFLIFGPSFIALSLSLPLAFSSVRISRVGILFIAAAVIHSVSPLFIVIAQAMCLSSSTNNTAFVYLLLGLGILFGLFCIRLSREGTKRG